MNPIKSLFKTLGLVAESKARKIDIKLKLDNAIEIQETQHIKLFDTYKDLLVRIAKLELKIQEMKKDADEHSKSKSKSAEEAEIVKVYTEGVEKLIAAKRKLEAQSESMKKHIKNHGVKIELLKAKKTYLDALKTVNGYLEEFNIDSVTDDSINAIIDEATAEAEAVNKAFEDIKTL